MTIALTAQEFYKAGGIGTRKVVIEDAGHQQFLDAGWAFNKGFDWLCKCGHTSRPVIFPPEVFNT